MDLKTSSFCQMENENTYCNIVDKEFLESIGHDMPVFLGSTITNIWHQILALETPSHSVINTLWFTPVLLKCLKLNDNPGKLDNKSTLNFNKIRLTGKYLKIHFCYISNILSILFKVVIELEYITSSLGLNFE